MSAPETKPKKPSYIKWGAAKILYLAYLAAGWDTADILPRLPNFTKRDKKGKMLLGITSAAVVNWRDRDPEWEKAERLTLEDPEWFHKNIGLPLKLANLDVRDLEYLYGLAGEWKGFQGKARELLLLEMNLLQGQSDASEVFRELASNIRIIANQPVPPPAPALTSRPVIDVTPVVTVKERDHADKVHP